MERDERFFAGDPVADDVALYALLSAVRATATELPVPTPALAKVLTRGMPASRRRMSLVRRLAAASVAAKIAIGASVAVAAGASAVTGVTPNTVVRDVVDSFDDRRVDPAKPVAPPSDAPDDAPRTDPTRSPGVRPSDVPSAVNPTGPAQPSPPRGRPETPGPVVTPPAAPPSDVPGRGNPGGHARTSEAPSGDRAHGRGGRQAP